MTKKTANNSKKTAVDQLLIDNPALAELRTKVSVAPLKPGVYRWKNKSGEVLYVGKAKQLRNRLKSYIQPAADTNLGPWKRSMLRAITDLEITVTRSELEALVLETNLIKEIRPKYNVLMKDDKNYVYVRISKDPFPVVQVLRRMFKDSAYYFGPFVSSYETKRMLELVHTVYPFMTSKDVLTALNKKANNNEDVTKPLFTVPPLPVQIGKHCGLGTGTYTKEQYNTAIVELKKFLRGQRGQVMQQLEVEMQEAAINRKYEKAAKLRDSLQYMRSLDEKQLVSDTTGENTDYIGLAVFHGYSQVVLMKEREGRLIAEQSFAFQGESDSELEVLQSFITQFYSDTADIPAVVVVPHEFEGQSVLQEWLTTLRGTNVELRVPERGKKVQLLELATTNAEQKVKQQEARWEAEKRATEAALQQLQALLQLPAMPARIEGYDISHLGGTETVGSMVVVKHGKAANDLYRSFTIKRLEDGQIDDYASLAEVLDRRLRYLVDGLQMSMDRLEAQGYTIRKALKKHNSALREQLHIPESDEVFNYKDCIVVLKDDVIVAAARLRSHDGIIELDSLYAETDVSTEWLEILLRFAIKPIKKGKIYCAVAPQYEALIAAIGGRVIHSSPKALGVTKGSIAMSIQVANQKPDVSLSAKPDLLVIDGGKGQLSTVKKVIDTLGLTIPVIGLAKREEEVFIPNQSYSIEIPKDSPALFLLTRLRNEAHRFANYQRERRGLKHYKQSALDSIAGIGPTTKQKLLDKFGTTEAIQQASNEELLLHINKVQLAQLRSSL